MNASEFAGLLNNSGVESSIIVPELNDMKPAAMGDCNNCNCGNCTGNCN